jgi:MFS family permease
MSDAEQSEALPMTVSAQTDEAATRGRNTLAAVVVIGHAIKHIFNSGLQNLLLPEVKIGLGLNAAQFGALLTARQFTSWGMTMGAGYLGDRFSNRAPLILGISLSLLGVSFFVAGRAPNYSLMFGAMLLAGLGPALYHPPALGELSRRFPDKRGFAISLHGAGGSAGEVMGPIIVAGLLTFMSWRGVFQVSLFPAVLSGVLVWGVMRSLFGSEPETASSRDYFSSIALVLKNPLILVLVLIAAVKSAGDSAVGGFLPVYLREDLDFSATRVVAGSGGGHRHAARHGTPVGQLWAPGYHDTRLGRDGAAVARLERRGNWHEPYADRGGQGSVQLSPAPHLHSGGHRRGARPNAIDGGGAHIRGGLSGDVLTYPGRADR